jgi:hypothetical protein
VQKAVKNLLALGMLPRVSSDPRDVERFEHAISEIKYPLTDDEAAALIECFGEDDSFGLAWTLVHLIETSPTAFPKNEPSEDESFWKRVLYQRYSSSLKQV